MDSRIQQLTLKVEQLEDDKRNLEELVSRNMSTITENFAQNKPEFSPMWVSTNHATSMSVDDNVRQLNDENVMLRKDLDKTQQVCAQLEEKLNRKSFEEAQVIEMQAALEDQEERTVELMERLKSEVKESTERNLLKRIYRATNLDGDLSNLPVPQQVCTKLSETKCLLNCINFFNSIKCKSL